MAKRKNRLPGKAVNLNKIVRATIRREFSHIKRSDGDAFAKALLDTMSQMLSEGRPIKIRDFGTITGVRRIILDQEGRAVAHYRGAFTPSNFVRQSWKTLGKAHTPPDELAERERVLLARRADLQRQQARRLSPRFGSNGTRASGSSQPTQP